MSPLNGGYEIGVIYHVYIHPEVENSCSVQFPSKRMFKRLAKKYLGVDIIDWFLDGVTNKEAFFYLPPGTKREDRWAFLASLYHHSSIQTS